MLEMYMSGEMEEVFRGFRETGFFRASEDHGPTALFGGITRALEIDRDAIADPLPDRPRRHPQRRLRPPLPGGGRHAATRCSPSPEP